MKEPTMG